MLNASFFHKISWHIKMDYVIIWLLTRNYVLEEYPSLAEGTGLENREVEQSAQGFESLFLRHLICQ